MDTHFSDIAGSLRDRTYDLAYSVRNWRTGFELIIYPYNLIKLYLIRRLNGKTHRGLRQVENQI